MIGSCIAMAGTIVAIITGIYQLWVDRKAKNREQAGTIACWLIGSSESIPHCEGRMIWKVHISNSSRQPVYDVGLVFYRSNYGTDM